MWEQVPLMTFAASAKQGPASESVVQKKARSKSNPLIALVIVAGLIALVTLLELIRR